MNGIEDAVRVFATDIDDTIAGDAVAERRFRSAWESLEPERRPLLIYNSGRSASDIQWLVLERRIPAPEFIIGGIGTEFIDPVDAYLAEGFQSELNAGWDRVKILHVADGIPGAQLQPAEYLNAYKLSWHWPRATAADIFRLEYRLREAGLDVNVSYTAGVFLDVLPRRAGKGNALAWLCRHIGVPLTNVLVAGAGGNNHSMFALPGVRGIATANASRDLLTKLRGGEYFISLEKTADGVLAGLEHFGVLHAIASPEDARPMGVGS